MTVLHPLLARIGVLVVLIMPVSAAPMLGFAPASADESAEQAAGQGSEEGSDDDPVDPKVSVDLHDARLTDVVLRFSQVTGENFVLMEKDLADKRITVYAPTPVTLVEARDLLITVLTLSGLRVEDKGAYYAITRAH